MSTKRPRSAPSDQLRRKGPNMIRNSPTQIRLVGLGVFPPRRRTISRDDFCCVPRCGKDEEVWAVWLWRGKIIVLPFCQDHADHYLLADEVGEALERAASMRRARALDARS